MNEVKRAHHLEIYLCDHCASVHIGLFRDGKLFAEAIPADARGVLSDMIEAVAESLRRQGAMEQKH